LLGLGLGPWLPSYQLPAALLDCKKLSTVPISDRVTVGPHSLMCCSQHGSATAAPRCCAEMILYCDLESTETSLRAHQIAPRMGIACMPISPQINNRFVSRDELQITSVQLPTHSPEKLLIRSQSPTCLPTPCRAMLANPTLILVAGPLNGQDDTHITISRNGTVWHTGRGAKQDIGYADIGL
jgi:hypothetical protein